MTEIENLKELQIQETSINYEGLKKLSKIKSLKDVCLEVYDDNYTYENLIELSAEMSNCTILTKGNGLLLNGKFDGKWEN